MDSAASRLVPFAGGWEAHRDRHCIWIVSPPNYIYSQAFEEVALALEEAFAELGGSAPIVRDPSRWAGRTPIVLGSHLLGMIGNPDLPPGSILFNMEQHQPGAYWMKEAYLGLLRGHPVLDYSPANRNRLREIGVYAGLLELGYSPSLTRIPSDVTKDIDVLFYGWVNDRREKALEAISRAGLQVAVCSNMYGKLRDEYIARARIVVNIHFFEEAAFETVRVSYLLANSVPVVSEGEPAHPEVEWLAGGVAFAPYEALPERCLTFVRDECRRERLADAGFQRITSRRQSVLLQRCIETGLSASLRGGTDCLSALRSTPSPLLPRLPGRGSAGSRGHTFPSGLPRRNRKLGPFLLRPDGNGWYRPR